MTVIDVGTGSGILAIAAARLGAARVLAIDSDPVAVAVASQNVRANHVADRVHVRAGVGLARVRLRADLIVANLTADALPGILAGVRRCLGARGRFVGSGFGAVRVNGVMRAMALAGLRPIEVDRLRGWRAVHAAAPRRGAR
jgi:ribosomal protein L11 methyltransferase